MTLRIRLERSFWGKNLRIRRFILLIIKIKCIAPRAITLQLPAQIDFRFPIPLIIFPTRHIILFTRHIIFPIRHLFLRIMLMIFPTTLRNHSLVGVVAICIARRLCMPYARSARFIPALPLC